VTDPGISEATQAFVADYIDSVLQLEVLLLLRARGDQPSSAEQISKELRIDAAWAAEQLQNLCNRSILVCTDEPVRMYRYQPTRDDLRHTVDDLAQAYADRRVAVVSLIYSKPMDKIRGFADAFRIRPKDKPNG
jgi:predicted ArsR family transcriptional regulator